MVSRLESLCAAKNVRMTEQRKVIAKVISESRDHPTIEELYNRANELNKQISLATVYRTVRLLEEADLLERHEFRNGIARYEERTLEHHDHLIDMETGDVHEFSEESLEEVLSKVAASLGYKLLDYRLELYGISENPEK